MILMGPFQLEIFYNPKDHTLAEGGWNAVGSGFSSHTADARFQPLQGRYLGARNSAFAIRLPCTREIST